MSLTMACVAGAFQQNYVLAQYCELVVLMPVINQDTPNAVNSSAWDATRSVSAAFSDGTFGVGWQAMYNGVLRMGYMPPVYINVAINDGTSTSQWRDVGLVNYESTPIVMYMATVLPQPKKWDLLIAPDGRRYVVGDDITPFQQYGQTVSRTAVLELRQPSDIVYTIPVK